MRQKNSISTEKNWAEVLRGAAEEGENINLQSLAETLGWSEQDLLMRLVRSTLDHAAIGCIYREEQRTICSNLLKSWAPYALPATPEAGKSLENGLKVGQFVLKVMERQARLANVDVAGDEEENREEDDRLLDPCQLQDVTNNVEGRLLASGAQAVEMAISDAA